jgi:Fe-S-cluster formation regulator IscX/YfhJ
MAATSQPLFDGPSFDLGIEEEEEKKDMENNQEVKKTESSTIEDMKIESSEIEVMENQGVQLEVVELNQMNENHGVHMEFVEPNQMNDNLGVHLEIVEPYDIGFLDLNRNVLDLNKFPDDGLDFGFENEELNKAVHNVLRIFLDSFY